MLLELRSLSTLNTQFVNFNYTHVVYTHTKFYSRPIDVITPHLDMIRALNRCSAFTYLLFFFENNRKSFSFLLKFNTYSSVQFRCTWRRIKDSNLGNYTFNKLAICHNNPLCQFYIFSSWKTRLQWGWYIPYIGVIQ